MGLVPGGLVGVHRDSHDALSSSSIHDKDDLAMGPEWSQCAGVLLHTHERRKISFHCKSSITSHHTLTSPHLTLTSSQHSHLTSPHTLTSSHSHLPRWVINTVMPYRMPGLQHPLTLCTTSPLSGQNSSRKTSPPGTPLLRIVLIPFW